ncbi:MAG: hypothetical protein PHU66_11155 [Bacteroidaceae bacterium]|nr:hypothetical protein [Bacteroidaceae bacterium]
MEYPKTLISNFIEIFEIEEEKYQIPKSNVSFEKWTGKPIRNNFGEKTLLNVDSKVSFAELAIVGLFVNEGWEARWVCTYGRGKQNPLFLKEWKDDNLKNQENSLIKEVWVMDLLNEVASLNGNFFSGCWDVVAWKDDEIVFAESKRKKKDSIRQTQTNWLEAGLKSGLTEENFLVIEWNIN